MVNGYLGVCRLQPLSPKKALNVNIHIKPPDVRRCLFPLCQNECSTVTQEEGQPEPLSRCPSRSVARTRTNRKNKKYSTRISLHCFVCCCSVIVVNGARPAKNKYSSWCHVEYYEYLTAKLPAVCDQSEHFVIYVITGFQCPPSYLQP